ncbi:MAG: EamA family transporter, partial [Thermoplasmataceae archaeon]
GFIIQVASLPLSGWLAILYLSILSTVIGYTMFYTLVNRGMVSRLSIQLYLIPVVGVVGGILLLGESITLFTVAGGISVLLAVGISTRNR